MSAFLGKIHYWLYNKIQIHEKFIDEVVKLCKNKGYDGKDLVSESYHRYGFPVRGELEKEIDHSNIHGWLQEKIISVESRMAYIITEVLKNNIINKEELSKIFYESAVSVGEKIQVSADSPGELFDLIFDYMLEGMPCDRINEITKNDETMVQWKTVKDIHKQYWDRVQGDVGDFYLLRDAWISGILKASGKKYKYTRTEDGINTIRQV